MKCPSCDRKFLFLFRMRNHLFEDHMDFSRLHDAMNAAIKAFMQTMDTQAPLIQVKT